MIDVTTIDLGKYRLIEEAGMIPRHQRHNYASDAFQEIIRRAFGDLVPHIRRDANGKYFHVNHDEESRETLSLSRELAPGEAWPRHEALRMLEGWGKLHMLAATVPNPRLRAMLYDLQFPHPRRNKRCYRIYTDVHGMPRMHVLLGFAKLGDRQRFTAAELMEQLQLDYQPEQPVLYLPARYDADDREVAAAVVDAGHGVVISPVLSLACVLALASIFLAYSITVWPVLASTGAL